MIYHINRERICMGKKTVLQRTMEQQEWDIHHFCKELGWDPERLRIALTDNSVPDLPFYLEEPYVSLIKMVGDFIGHAENSLFVIYAPHGYGKTSLRNYTIQSIKEFTKRYFFIRVDDPGLMSHVQLARTFLKGIGIEQAPRNMDDIKAVLVQELSKARDQGVSTIIWIDEGQKLTADMISLIRILSDIQTQNGLKICKFIITGTPQLKARLDKYEVSHPEEITAFRERLAINVDELKPWTAENIETWWQQVAQGLGGSQSPFEETGAAEVMHRITEGVPRSIVQLTRYVIVYKAQISTGTTITGEDIQWAFLKRVNHG